MDHDAPAATGHLLADLNAEQRTAVTHPHHPLAIVAGAGSGKTRVLTRRVAHRAATGDLDPQRALVLTFTRKAATELRQRLARLGLRDQVPAGTFHAAAYAQLRQRWADLGGRPPELLDRRRGFVARVVGRNPPVPVADLVAEIEWAKARIVGPGHYEAAAAAAGRRPPADPAVVAELYGSYERAKHAQRLVDFDDLLHQCRRHLERDPTFARGVRWRFRHLFVDEFQDVNPLQFALLRAWLGDRPDLCVVGDPRQAIYGWNGADAGYLEQFTTHFPDGHVLELVRNHRSTPQILGVAHAVAPASTPLEPVRGDGPLPTVHSATDDTAEAAGIARSVREAHRPGSPWGRQAVLARTNAQLAPIAEALRAAGVPVRTRGGASLVDTVHVKDALRWLNRTPTPLAAALAELADDLGEAGDGDTLTDSETAATRRADLETVVRFGTEYLALDPGADARGFVAWLRSTLATEADDRRDAVELATFHGAKGLEWPVVHLAGLEDGYVPIAHARTAAALTEEQRLLYVAVTRAEEELHVTWAKERTFGTRTSRRDPSPHLDAILGALGRLGQTTAPAAGRARVRQVRRALHDEPEPAPVDDPLLVALQRWRTTTARAADVPAHVVFPDAALEEVARSRPRRAADLEGIAGIGPMKARRYGPDLLDLVAAHTD